MLQMFGLDMHTCIMVYFFPTCRRDPQIHVSIIIIIERTWQTTMFVKFEALGKYRMELTRRILLDMSYK